MPITTINIPEKVKEKGRRASKEVFGRENLSAYIQMLINKDCKERNVE